MTTDLTEHGASRTRRGMSARARAIAGVLLASLSLPAAAATAPAHAAADGEAPAGVVSAQFDSYAMRVEYDIPLPVGTGSVAHVSGEVRRSEAGENAKGVAAAPTEMDAVVSGKYIDPQGTGHPQRNLPQSECFYPGSLVDTHFYFPTDTQAESQTSPPVGYATARCGAGPETELHGHAQGSDAPGGPTSALAPIVTTGAVNSDALARPLKGAIVTDTASRASGISILGGVIKVGSVVARGHSLTTGQQGGAATDAAVSVSDIEAGGVTFGLASASTNGQDQVQLTVAGQTVPLDSSAAKTVIDTANAGIKGQGCSITPLSTPDTYPQGYLFSRPQPPIGVSPDGSAAASYRGGLLIVCDPPRTVTDNADGFSPQRAQILLGFAFTSVSAKAGAGGFNFGDLGSAIGGGTAPVLGGSGSLPSAPLSTGSGTGLPTTDGAVATGPAAAPAPAAAVPAKTTRAAAIRPFHMAPGTRWLLGLLGLLGWALLTHLGAQRFLVATAACGARDGAEAL